MQSGKCRIARPGPERALDKLNLDIFRLSDDSLPEPEVPAAEIVENLEAAPENFAA